jgi:hypothetical protein
MAAHFSDEACAIFDDSAETNVPTNHRPLLTRHRDPCWSASAGRDAGARRTCNSRAILCNPRRLIDLLEAVGETDKGRSLNLVTRRFGALSPSGAPPPPVRTTRPARNAGTASHGETAMSYCLCVFDSDFDGDHEVEELAECDVDDFCELAFFLSAIDCNLGADR